MHQTTPIDILVIEDNPGDFLLLKEFLRLTSLPIKSVTNADRLEQAFILLKEQSHDLVFLDLSLPDSEGIESFISLQKKAAHLPIIVLSGLTDVTIALESITLGAQDYLVKGEYTDKLLAKTIQYSIERKRNELKLFESNRRYELLSQATNDTIWDWDLHNNQVTWNDGIKTIFGYNHTDIKSEINWWQQNIHSEDKERVIAKIYRHIESGIKIWKDEYRFRCYNGSYKYVYDRGFILFDKDSKPSRLIGAMQDLTDRRKLEQQLTNEKINKQKQLTQATIEGQEKERSEISRELHDNINQVLVTIKLYLELATDDPKLKDDLIKRSVERIMYCITEIRTLSKSLAPPSLNDHGLIEAITELVDNLRLTKTFNIDLNLKLESLQFSNLQQLYIYRIIQEQLNNIIKHANAKNVWVELIENYHYVDLIIRDDGQGFNPKEKSSGIGLTNIQNRAELLNGTLEIISAVNDGCVLKVRIAEKSYQNLIPDLL